MIEPEKATKSKSAFADTRTTIKSLATAIAIGLALGLVVAVVQAARHTDMRSIYVGLDGLWWPIIMAVLSIFAVGVAIAVVRPRIRTVAVIVGIAGRVGFTTIVIEKDLMNQQRGFGRRVLEVLENHNVSFEHMPTAIDSMSVVVSDDELEGKESAIVREIKRNLEPDKVELYPALALIATVGEGMVYRVGIAGQRNETRQIRSRRLQTIRRQFI